MSDSKKVMLTPGQEMAAKGLVRGGTVAGAIAGSALGPVGTVVGAAIGFLGGKKAADKVVFDKAPKT